MATHFTAGMGALWVQVDGPNTQPVYLGCHQLGDIEEPQGDVELIYCPDPSAPNRFIVVGSVQGAAGSVTTSITTDVTDSLDYLERILCPFPLYVHMLKAGRKDVFTNFDRTFILTGARVTSKGLTALAARTPDDNSRSEQSFDLSGESLLRFVLLTLSSQTIGLPDALNDVTFCNDQTCATDEAAAVASCQTGYAASDAASGATPDILITTNGATWAATAADPFAIDEDAIAVDCFELGRDSIRVVVACGTTDAAAPPKISYSDDSGVTWTDVVVGVTAGDNAQFIPTRHSLFVMDRNAMWVGDDAGHVYKSVDAGLTWTTLDSGTVITGAINAIFFADSDVGFIAGAANGYARTLDGGLSWSTFTGPNPGNGLLCLYAFDRNRVWVGDDTGALWYTEDGGTTWAQRSISGSGVGEVRDIKFMNDHVGYLLKDAAVIGVGPNTVQYTIDGGYTWSVMTTPANAGLNSLYLCDLWKMYFCGEPVSSLGLMAQGTV